MTDHNPVVLGKEEMAAEKKVALDYRGPTKDALLWTPAKGLPQKKVVRCRLCAHYCLIPPGGVGACLVRKNEGGRLRTVNWGQADGLAIDPIEKKPFFHFKPGSQLLSFGTPGCNFRCLNCQNWQLSQAMKQYGPGVLSKKLLEPQEIAGTASREKVDGIAYTYSEPTIFFEYAYDTIQECRKLQAKGKLPPDFFHVFVSNGYFSKEMLALVAKEKLLSAIRIDLKFMDDAKYWRICGGRLQNVLDSIKRVAALRQNAGWPIHLEVINLVIPGENDSDDDFRAVSSFIHSLSPSIPLHFSRFFPQYKMDHVLPTPIERLERAKSIAQDEGLHFAYIGNTGLLGAEDTHCPNCGELLIARNRFGIEKNVFENANAKMRANPACPKCGQKIDIVL